jgi:carbon-monoxide dehydrogenase medium subunit
MKPAPFEYADPRSLEEAVALLAQHEGEARLLAGGQSLMPLMNMRLARPELVVDINRVPGLDYIRETENGGLAVGAMTRQRAIERSNLVQARQPLLHAATKLIAHPQIRNRGTVGGSLAHADPAAEYPAVALALDAELRAKGPNGERAISAADFFVTYLTTALDPAEMLTELRLPPMPPRSGWAFHEVARRRGDFAIAGVATVLSLDGGQTCSSARIVLFGVAPKAIRAREAEHALNGEKAEETSFAEAARRAAAALDEPLSDIHASADYRRHLAEVLTRRALSEAAARAQQAA